MKPSVNRFLFSKITKSWIKLSEFDVGKRSLFTGLGTFLAACTAPQPEQKADKKFQPVTYIPGTDSSNTNTDKLGEQGVECGTCPPTKNPVKVPSSNGGVTVNPVPPPETGVISTDPSVPPSSGVIDPVSPPSTITSPLPALSIQTYKTLGPSIANLRSSDMFAGITQVMSDGKAIIVWGFTDMNNNAFNGEANRLCPGPVIEMIQNQDMSVQLISSHPHSIHLHGLDVSQAYDGVPSTSGYVAMVRPPGTPGFITGVPGINLGQTFTYRLIAPHAGTYMYHCHVDTVLHIEMGMSGTIIVRPPDGNRNQLFAQAPNFDREYIWQLHTFDSSWHAADRSASSGSGTMRYKPDYFMINGRDGSDIAADSASAIKAFPGQKVAVRLVNIGYMPAIVKLGGISFDIMCADGRPLTPALTRRVEWLIAPGERYDIMFTMPQGGATNFATVVYLDIRGRSVLGTAVSTITAL